MGLCNLYEYQQKKSIKLSDSYSVTLWLTDKDFAKDDTPKEDKARLLNFDAIPENYAIELFNCTDVALPSFKYKSEIYKYGNNEKTFLIPDYSSLDDLTIELMDYYDANNNLVVEQLVNLFLNKLFDTRTFTYRMNDFIKGIDINVYDNNFSSKIQVYSFRNLKLTNYTKYELDYASNNPAKWKLSFSFMEYQATQAGERTYGVGGEIDPNLGGQTETNIELNEQFAAMYAASMQGRSMRAPTEASSMLTPNAHTNNSVEIDQLSKKTSSLSKKVNSLKANVATQTKKVEELKSKLAVTESKSKELKSAVDSNETKYAAAFAKTQGLVQNAQQNQMKGSSADYWSTAKYEEDLKKHTAANNALNANLALRKEASDAARTAKSELTAVNNDLAKLQKELEAEEAKLNKLSKEYNNTKSLYNKNKKSLNEMSGIKKDQIVSLENRFGTNDSIPQKNNGASLTSYADSMAQAAKAAGASKKAVKESFLKEEDEARHMGANNLATMAWGRTTKDIYSELDSLDLPDLMPDVPTQKSQESPKDVKPKAETLYSREDKILALTIEYEKTHPEWSDAYIYERASNVVDTESGL
jgi:archaellum component FlaC